MSPMPEYIEYGGRATAPPPFLSTEGRFRGYLLEGDANLIANFCDRVLNGPAGGTSQYKPLLDKYVLLQTGAFGKVSSQAKGFDNWGFVEEAQISLWVPVQGWTVKDGQLTDPRVCMACPYILVNNPMSYAGGREDYGYPKSLGRFDPEGGLGDPLTVEAFGGNFDPANRADWHALFKLSRTSSGPATAQGGAGAGAGEEAATLLQWAERGGLELPDIGELEAIIAALSGKKSMQVFLKQFRDVSASDEACYQAIVEAPIEYISSTTLPSLEEWSVEIHELDSHPIGRELGVYTQPTRATFDVRMDMVAAAGRVVAP
jgi:hypothetical protein